MSPIEFLAIVVAIAGVGVLGLGISILHSIKQRSKPLKQVTPPRTPFDEAVAQAAEEFRRELDEARAEELAKAKRGKRK